MFFRSPSGTSPGIGSASFSTGRLSPVKALSAHFRLALSSRRPSAQTESPASSSTTSPGTTSQPGICVTRPSRSTLAVGAAICFRLSRDVAAFTVCTVPSTAFSVTTARITSALSPSPSRADTAAARSRITTSKSRNCSRKMRSTFFFFSVRSSLGPYVASRSRASTAVSPSSRQSRSRSSSFCVFCQIRFSCFISSIPSGMTQKTRPLRQCLSALLQKSRHFNPKRGNFPVLTPADAR